MVNFQKNRNKKNNIWYSPIILFLMLVLIIIFSYNMIDLVEKVRETAKKKDFANEQVDRLKEREKILTEKLGKLETQEGIEEEIREKYQLVKEGERLVIIVDKDEEGLSEDEKSKNKKGFTGFFKNLFK